MSIDIDEIIAIISNYGSIENVAEYINGRALSIDLVDILYECILINNIDLLKYFIDECNFPINELSDHEKNHILQRAVYKGNYDITLYLLKKNFNTDESYCINVLDIYLKKDGAKLSNLLLMYDMPLIIKNSVIVPYQTAYLNFINNVPSRWLMINRKFCYVLPYPYFQYCIKARLKWRQKLNDWRWRAIKNANRPPTAPIPQVWSRKSAEEWLSTGGTSFAKYWWKEGRFIFDETKNL